jgi:hypothetical protein
VSKVRVVWALHRRLCCSSIAREPTSAGTSYSTLTHSLPQLLGTCLEAQVDCEQQVTTEGPSTHQAICATRHHCQLALIGRWLSRKSHSPHCTTPRVPPEPASQPESGKCSICEPNCQQGTIKGRAQGPAPA